MTLPQYLCAVLNPCMAVFCAVAAVYVVMTRGGDTKSARLLCGTLITGFVLNAQQTLEYCYRGNLLGGGHSVVGITRFVVFVCLFVLIAFEIEYVWRRSELRGGTKNQKLRIFGLIFCGIGAASVMFSRIFHFYYTVDDEDQFVKMDSYWVLMVIIGLATLPLLIQTLQNKNVFHRREFRAFLILVLLPAAAAVLQSVMKSGLSLYSVSISISILILFVVYRREASDTTIIRESLKLSNENIFMVFEGLERFMQYFDMEKRNRFKVRMTMEEILLRMRDHFGEDEEFDIFALVYFGKPQIRIEKKGEIFNPLRKEDTEVMNWSGSMLTSIGLSPVYSYSGGKNILRLSLQRMAMNPALKMMIALFIGIVAGYIGIHDLTAADLQFVNEEVLKPVYGLMSNLLYCVTGPILFLMVVTVILDTVGISEQGGNSLYIVGRYLFLSYIIGLVPLGAVMGGMGNRIRGEGLFSNDANDLIDGLLSIIPKNIFDPFVEANTPQLMLMAIILGLSTAVLGARTKGLNELLRQGNLVGMHLAQWIGRIIPYFAIVMAALIYMTNHIVDLMALIPVLLGAVAITLVCMAVALLYISIREAVRPGILIRKCWPSFLNALKTGGVDSSYGLAERCCTIGLGVERHFAGVGLPLGLVMYMPANVVGTVLFIIFAAVRSQVTISPLWMLVSVLLAVVLFVATPPIPGANFLAYIVMISMMGINGDFLMLALIYEIIYGTFASPANQFFVQIEMILQSKKMGLLNEEALRRPEKRKASARS